MKALKGFVALVVALLLGSNAHAQTVFPVDTASATTLTNVATDVVSWGVAIMAIALTYFAYRWIRKVARG
jgi:hypothetical protein